jgi:hypothetical protein
LSHPSSTEAEHWGSLFRLCPYAAVGTARQKVKTPKGKKKRKKKKKVGWHLVIGS